MHLVKIALVTNIFEWYEFSISTFLAVVIGHLFFAVQNAVVAAIASFALLALSYFIRPLGSICFGYIGDKYGSNLALNYSMCLMAIPTFIIGILPTCNNIGYWATLLIIILKLIQGFAAGGELPVSASYVYEKSNTSRHGNLLCSLISVGSMGGMLLASFIAFLLYAFLPESSIYNFGWRIPFLLSLPLSIFIFRLRQGMLKNDFFCLKTKWFSTKTLIITFKSIIIVSFTQVTMYILFVWMPTYLQYFVDLPYQIARTSNIIAMLTLALFTIGFGLLGKFIDYKKIILVSSIILVCTIYPLMTTLTHSTSFIQVLLIQLVFTLIFSAVQGSFFYALANVFTQSFRNKGMAISFSIGTALFGGTAPIICSYFIHQFNLVAFPSLYIMVWGLLAIFVFLF